MVVEHPVTLLETVQLLDNGNGDDHIVLVELMDTRTVVQNDIRIQNEYFL